MMRTIRSFVVRGGRMTDAQVSAKVAQNVMKLRRMAILSH